MHLSMVRHTCWHLGRVRQCLLCELNIHILWCTPAACNGCTLAKQLLSLNCIFDWPFPWQWWTYDIPKIQYTSLQNQLSWICDARTDINTPTHTPEEVNYSLTTWCPSTCEWDTLSKGVNTCILQILVSTVHWLAHSAGSSHAGYWYHALAKIHYYLTSLKNSN